MTASLLHKIDPDAPGEKPTAWKAGEMVAVLAVPALLLAYLLLAMALPCLFDLPID